MGALVLATALRALALAAQPQATAPAPGSSTQQATAPETSSTQEATASAPTQLATAEGVAAPATAPTGGCAAWKHKALGEGPLAVGYAQADLGVGRRVCPRTEASVGLLFGAIIDTPNFYGNVGLNALLAGSYALGERTELFATLEAIDFQFAQNATLSTTALSLGNLTVGATRHLYGERTFLGGLSARLLLPTATGIPGARLVGAEISHVSSWRPLAALEVHSTLGADFTAAISAGSPYPRVAGALSLGLQWSPFTWAALVVDLTGRLAARSLLAPTVGLRFRIFRVGIELGGSLPLVGTDRHDLVAGVRVAYRFD